jgi:hypothetical protein
MLRGVGHVRQRRGAARPDVRVVSIVISDTEELERVGAVSTDRYRQLVDRGRELVGVLSGCQFALGDLALEIEPMRSWGGSVPGSTVIATLELFAEEIGVPYKTIDTYRWVSSRWPVGRRDPAVGWTVHKTLAAIHDERERFAAIADPPEHPRLGRMWTQDGARRLVGQTVDHPVTVQEKVTAIHDLAKDERVAVAVAADLLRRPEVAFKAMADRTARHIVNRAQIDHAVAGTDVAREKVAAGRVVLEKVVHAAGFVELVGACAAFVAAAGRIVPSLAQLEFTDTEQATVAGQLVRVRAAADWIEHAVESGNVSLDEGLAELLRGR